MHEWISVCLPEVPNRADDDDGGVVVAVAPSAPATKSSSTPATVTIAMLMMFFFALLSGFSNGVMVGLKCCLQEMLSAQMEIVLSAIDF